MRPALLQIQSDLLISLGMMEIIVLLFLCIVIAVLIAIILKVRVKKSGRITHNSMLQQSLANPPVELFSSLQTRFPNNPENKDGLLNQLSQIQQLKDKGVLTEENYQKERQIVLDKLSDLSQ